MAESAKTTADVYLDVIHIILNDGYEIMKLKDQAYNPNHMDGKKNSDPVLLKVNRYIDQGKVYDHIERWFKETEETFKECALNYPKFLATIHLNGKRGTNPLYLIDKFELAIQEMVKIAESTDYLATYLSPSIRKLINLTPASQDASYSGGTITQGTASHTFTKSDYIGLLNTLWPHRRIIYTLSGKKIPGSPKSKAVVEKAVGIDDKRLKTMAIGLNQELSKKGINVSLHRPDHIYIEVVVNS